MNGVLCLSKTVAAYRGDKQGFRVLNLTPKAALFYRAGTRTAGFFLLTIFLLFCFFLRGAAQDPVDCTPPTATLKAVSSGCRGGTVSLQLESATGQPPFDVVVNGITYNDVEAGRPFALISADQSIWGADAVPDDANVDDGTSIEVGVKFQSAVDGYITGLRFYKGAANSGTHVGSLWSASGTQLASAEFTSETASGWQVVSFAAPVAITANATYIASYVSPKGIYAYSGGFFANEGITNGSLTALQSKAEEGNGVYKYGSGFPDNSFNSSNYWVDVLFTSSPFSSQRIGFTLTSIVDGRDCAAAGVALSTDSVTLNPLPAGSLKVDGLTCEYDTIKLGFDAGSGTGPFNLLINGKMHTNINSGAVFSTGQETFSAISIWSNGALPSTAAVAVDNSSTELGVKFKSTAGGKVLGVRFYKALENTGAHTGSLWKADGTLLATGTFANESASGWQQLLFATPVPIEPDTVYVASYHTPVGMYMFSPGYFADSATSNSFLRALRSGESGPNGLYRYGTETVFPNDSYNNAHYWVDVVFKPDTVFTPETIQFNFTTLTDASNCSLAGSPMQKLEIVPVSCPPSLMDSLAPLTCSPQRLKLVFQNPIRCASVAADGSDFRVQGSYPVTIRSARADCSGNGYASVVYIELEKPLQQGGDFKLLLQNGGDGNTLVNEQNQHTPVGSALSFQVSDTVNARFMHAIRYGCTTDTVSFYHAGGNGVNSWLWSLDDNLTSTAQSPQAVYSLFGAKTIQLVVSNGFCSDTATTAFVLDNTLVADFTVTAKECGQEPAAFTSTATGTNLKHQWSFGDGAFSDEASPLHTYQPGLPGSGTYQVTYTVTDAFGCTKSVTKPLSLLSNCTVYVPSAFTPDGDGRNDLFKPLNTDETEQLEFTVLNRWGQVLFVTKKAGEGWNGHYKSQPQAMGTYIWMLHYIDGKTKQRVARNGTFVLIR